MKLIQIKSNQMQVFFTRAEKRSNKLNPHLTPGLEIEPRPRWWEVSALTSMPPLLSKTGSLNRERNADVLF